MLQGARELVGKFRSLKRACDSATDRSLQAIERSCIGTEHRVKRRVAVGAHRGL